MKKNEKIEKAKKYVRENPEVVLITFGIGVAIGAFLLRKKTKTPIPIKRNPLPQSLYSFWGSPMRLPLADKIAEGYNLTVDSFIDAQLKHKERYGREWDPNEPLLMKTNPEATAAYNAVGRIISLLAEINGGAIDLSDEICVSDHLEKIEGDDLGIPSSRPTLVDHVQFMNTPKKRIAK